VDRSIVGQRYVSNAAMTLAAISATIPVIFDGMHQHLFSCCRYRRRDVQII